MAGIVYGAIRHPKETVLLSIFPVAYFAFISNFIVRNDRTFLPLAAFLFVLAAWFLIELPDKFRTLQPESLRKPALAILAGLALVALAQPISKTIADARSLETVNSRETARVWIDNNLPPGAKVAIESYAPFVDPSRFAVQGFVRMIENAPEWYSEQGFDYLVFSQGIYGRFYREPERYHNEKSQYDALFEYFNPVMILTDGDYEIRILSIK
ncbi:MAG: hypothetical protein BWY63_02664 [Chloroflexi bacterium ADurb.Bin360]|nr:MAG: hypothetical protein BWY63_02664 [Chloroflexi bacterium ADurb.Bin360]